MKNLTLLLLLIIYLRYMFCIGEFLSKFHQNGFKVKDFRVEVISYSKKYFHFMDFKTFKYNRTTPVVNGTFKLKIAVKDKTEVLVQAYKFLSNEYRHFPVRYQVNLRKSFEANVIGLDRAKDCGNITTYSFEKDVTYYVCNFAGDETQLPPLIPNGRYKVDVTLLYLQEEIAVISIFGEVYIPIKYPKN